jgi:DNA repair photolyase
MELLCANVDLVQAQIGITTLDEGISSMFEPGAAPPAERLKQIESLCSGGVRLRARLDPLIVGWTDGSAGLDALCCALGASGVDELSASALFVRPEISRTLKQLVPNQEMAHALLRHYPVACSARSAAGRRGERSLGRALRQRMYESARQIAEGHGIAVSVCGCENPDITLQRCGIAGDWSGVRTASRQTMLFGAQSGEACTAHTVGDTSAPEATSCPTLTQRSRKV